MRTWHASIVCVSLAVLVAGEQPWKDKKAAEWTEDDAKVVLTDSPWAKPVAPQFDRQQGMGSRGGGGRRGGMGGGGIGLPGIGIGLPGSRGGGMGGPGMGGPGGGGQRGGSDDGTGRGSEQRTPPTLIVRWESALPVQEAQLKAHDTSAVTIDENHYTIVVSGFPSRMSLENVKPSGELKREGKKAIKPFEARMLSRENGYIAVFTFPRSQEISKKDGRITLKAKIGQFSFEQGFELDEMVYADKLEL